MPGSKSCSIREDSAEVADSSTETHRPVSWRVDLPSNISVMVKEPYCHTL